LKKDGKPISYFWDVVVVCGILIAVVIGEFFANLDQMSFSETRKREIAESHCNALESRFRSNSGDLAPLRELEQMFVSQDSSFIEKDYAITALIKLIPITDESLTVLSQALMSPEKSFRERAALAFRLYGKRAAQVRSTLEQYCNRFPHDDGVEYVKEVLERSDSNRE